MEPLNLRTLFAQFNHARIGLFSQLPRCIQLAIEVRNDYLPSFGPEPIQIELAMRLGEYFAATHIDHPRLVELPRIKMPIWHDLSEHINAVEMQS